MILKGYLFTYSYIILILIITSILSEVFHINKIITRKITHILVTFTFLIMFYYFKYSIHMLIPPISFIILNLISYKLEIFKGMENKNSLGTIYYPISVFIMALCTYYNNDLISGYAIGMFCMGIGDGFAPIVAKYIKSKMIFNNKTVTGSVVVFITSFIVVISFNNYFHLNYSYLTIIFIACVSMVIELLSKKGLDNIFLPLGLFILIGFIGVM